MGLFSADAKGGKLAAIFQNATRKEAVMPQKVTIAEQDKDNESDSAASESEDSENEVQNQNPEESEESEELEEPEKPVKKARKAKDEDNLEEEYFNRLLGADSTNEPKKEAASTTKKTKDAKSQDRSKDARTDGEEDKNDRTVFVGNVSSQVVSDRQIAKQFKQLFSTVGPVASVRFRSIAFSEQLPRRAAYIKQKVHDKRDSVNAYVVFKSVQHSVEACKLNGELFDDHHLRVDHVTNPAEQNRKRSVFVGNLDFEATEEALYRHFMGCGPIEYVRIVRDSKTNVGKGFAYVQFQDTAAIPAALMLNEKDFSGRKLRVTHSKQHTSKPTAKAPVRSNSKGKSARPNRKPRTRAANPETQVLEGERAKQGDKIGLGRKRKARHENNPRKRRN